MIFLHEHIYSDTILISKTFHPINKSTFKIFKKARVCRRDQQIGDSVNGQYKDEYNQNSSEWLTHPMSPRCEKIFIQEGFLEKRLILKV